MRGVDLIPDTVCKSRWCRQILSRLRADLRENPIKQWASRDALIQSAGSISDSARYHSDANIALGPILKMYIPGQIRIFNALNSDGYSTGNAPPSGNNGLYYLCPYRSTLQLALSDKRNCVFVLCSFELRVPNVCICCKVLVGLVPFLMAVSCSY